VHAWLVPVAVAHEVGQWLDDEEQARAGRFKVEHAAVLYTAAHGALRVLLGRHLDCRPDELRFDTAGTGKPFLVGDPPLRFNLSHSGELAVVAVAQEREVGVDVELRRPITRTDGVARRIMTPDELARYQSLPTEER